uniref:Uncharacterized protein n=1 Tax=Timema douglasi TaxID=61478 RepID=A0A7R8Z7S7_TIMDO|nr:unnamed protein product [Timema douglasi]
MRLVVLQGKASGERAALWLRARLQAYLFQLGCFLHSHAGKVLFVAILVLATFCVGLKSAQVHTRVDQLWVQGRYSSLMASLVLTDSSQLTSDSQHLGIYSSPMASLVLTDSSQLTSDSRHLGRRGKAISVRVHCALDRAVFPQDAWYPPPPLSPSLTNTPLSSPAKAKIARPSRRQTFYPPFLPWVFF